MIGHVVFGMGGSFEVVPRERRRRRSWRRRTVRWSSRWANLQNAEKKPRKRDIIYVVTCQSMMYLQSSPKLLQNTLVIHLRFIQVNEFLYWCSDDCFSSNMKMHCLPKGFFFFIVGGFRFSDFVTIVPTMSRSEKEKGLPTSTLRQKLSSSCSSSSSSSWIPFLLRQPSRPILYPSPFLYPSPCFYPSPLAFSSVLKTLFSILLLFSIPLV